MNPDDMTIADIAVDDPNFDILVTALDAAGLVDAVADPEASLTVFAPTDDAFAQLAADLGYTGDPSDETAVFNAIAMALAGLAEDGDPIPLLSDVLLYHVLPAEFDSTAVTSAESLTTLQGAAISPDGTRLIDLEPDLLDPNIVAADIEASNGIVHAIDRVLLPLDVPGNDTPSIADIAIGNEDFEVLTAALDAAGLVATLDDDDAEFTVFAPTDDAFAQLATDLGFEGDTSDADAVFDAIAGALSGLAEDGDPIPLLTDILLYHVSQGAETEAELIAAASVDTLNGTPVIPSESGIIDADPEALNANFIEGLTDLGASNGTVQAIDRVLLPLDLESPAPTASIADIVAASGDGFDDDTGDFDVLNAALGAADLIGTLDSPDVSVTVAAPTDAAFIELAVSLGATPADEAEAFDAIVTTLTALAEDDDPIPLLTDILLYHVYEGALTRTDLAASPELTSLTTAAPAPDGEKLVDADPDLRDPFFVDAASDIVATNGIVHAIDRVLLPLDVDEAIGSGGPGDDTITVNPGTVAVMGGAGSDTAVIDAALADTSFTPIEGGFAAEIDGQSVDFMGIETFQFSDETVIVDTGETSASVARLYLAALDRDGDVPGQTFWTGVAETQGLDAVADNFITSDEFQSAFGEDPSHAEYIDALYLNTLGREADEAGREFWTGVFDSGNFDVSDLLVFFSESPEFRETAANSFDDGVLLIA